jgi:uncharacterized protein (TIGR02265 family)
MLLRATEMPSPPLKRFRVLPNVALVGNVDAEARVAAIRPTVTTKGMYLADLMARLDERHVQEVWPTLLQPPSHRKYQPFLDYPFADALRWLHAVARHRSPSVSLLEGLRRLGRDTVKVFLASRAGQVVRSMNLEPRDALLRMPAMWKVTDPSAAVVASERGANEVHFAVRGFPGWIDCGLIGTLEQVVLSRDAQPQMDVVLLGPEQGEFTVRWSRAGDLLV